jgi:hypothetical protein
MIKQQNITWAAIAAVVLGTLACASLINLSPPNSRSTPTVNQPTVGQPTATVATPTPFPTPVPPTSTPTLEPSATPTQVVSTGSEASITTPDVDFADLSPYRQAMLPDFATDVDTVAAGGASHYYIDLTSDPENFNGNDDLLFNGVERIRYTNTEAESLSEIYFRLYPNFYGGRLEIETVVVDGQLVAPLLEAANSALRVPLSEALSPGSRVDISLFYTITVPANSQQGYNIFSYSNQTAALATFYPVIAVYDDDGWNVDVPVPYGDATYLDVSLYQVRLTVPENMVVTASGSLLARSSEQAGSKTVWLTSGPMRDFYLAMRKDYQVLSEVVDGTLVNSYYPPGLEAGAQLTLRYAADALRIFNQRFGPYPYAEFDVVATPTTAGGVEYPGIVAIAENLYGQTGGFFRHATAHEVAHQWWYALVGNDQVNEPWLDESLTNYSATIYWEEIEGPETAARIIDGFFLGPYERAKRQGNDRAVIGPVSDFTVGEYSAFVYGKGPLFFRALRQEVGDEIYFKIMQTYYAEHKYKIATADSLIKTIEQVSGRDVAALVEAWLYSE